MTRAPTATIHKKSSMQVTPIRVCPWVTVSCRDSAEDIGDAEAVRGILESSRIKIVAIVARMHD